MLDIFHNKMVVCFFRQKLRVEGRPSLGLKFWLLRGRRSPKILTLAIELGGCRLGKEPRAASPSVDRILQGCPGLVYPLLGE